MTTPNHHLRIGANNIKVRSLQLEIGTGTTEKSTPASTISSNYHSCWEHLIGASLSEMSLLPCNASTEFLLYTPWWSQQHPTTLLLFSLRFTKLGIPTDQTPEKPPSPIAIMRSWLLGHKSWSPTQKMDRWILTKRRCYILLIIAQGWCK